MSRIKELIPEFDDRKKYSAREVGEWADQLLREDSRSEICRQCGGQGERTGTVMPMIEPVMDKEGTILILDFPEYECQEGHHWYQGEGAVRGIGGENPILFEEHFQSRRRREIYTSLGSPDPSIVSGMYNRAHPQGRKINSEKARREHGASWYK